LYICSDVDFKHGTDITYEDDTLLIEDEIDCSGADVDLTDLGLTISLEGTPAFTIGDTASFYVRKPNTSSVEVVFGGSGSEFSEVGVVLAGAKQSDGTIQSVELYKCKMAGMPIGFSEKAWAEWSCTIKALYDEDQDAVGIYRRTHAA